MGLHADDDVFPSLAQDEDLFPFRPWDALVQASPDSFDGINANKARKVDFRGESSMYRHDNIYSSSRPAASSDPTKRPHVHTQREEPLRDAALPNTSDDTTAGLRIMAMVAYQDLTLSSDGHYRNPSYHGEGAYRDLTLSSSDDPITSGAANMVKEKRDRQVRI